MEWMFTPGSGSFFPDGNEGAPMKEKLIILGLAVLGMGIVFLLFYLIRPRSRFPYVRRDLLTTNEFPFYQLLEPLCRKHGWLLLVKMRLADILAVAPGEKDYMAYFNKIKAKHTDFVLCDPDTLEVLCGVELDDPSHDRPERIERDEFVDHVCALSSAPHRLLRDISFDVPESQIVAGV